jgi:ABC-type ATPase with predicted acetyltransferase domain
MSLHNHDRRATVIANWFGVDPADDPYQDECSAAPALDQLNLRPGQILLITGPSGAGKSTLLRRLRGHWRSRRGGACWIDLARIGLKRRRVIDLATEALPRRAFKSEEFRIAAALEMLCRVGLGEVWTYLRFPSELSEGQRWRLRVALAVGRVMWRRAVGGRLVVLGCDEFCAVLDRVTAVVVARALRRCVDVAGREGRRQVCAVVATSHEDLAAGLGANLRVRCDFGRVGVVGG